MAGDSPVVASRVEVDYDPHRPVRVFKIRPHGEHAWLYVRTLAEAAEHVDVAGEDDGPLWEIDCVSMSYAKFSTLPEFGGW